MNLQSITQFGWSKIHFDKIHINRYGKNQILAKNAVDSSLYINTILEFSSSFNLIYMENFD